MDDASASPASDDRGASAGSLDLAMRALLAPLGDRLAKLEAKLDGERDATPASSSPASAPLGANPGSVESRLGAIERALAGLHDALDVLTQRLETRAAADEASTTTPTPTSPTSALCPPQPTTTSPANYTSSSSSLLGTSSDAPECWESVVLSRALCDDRRLDAHRSQFLRDVAAGNTAARGLAGQLLLIQAAATEELPERFKHVGEAYYRWRPTRAGDDDPFERALAEWLTQRAEAAGLKNSIQLVRVGDRFDSQRHVSSGRGVEVAGVRGWIVLRDNNKVYTKADVAVK